MIDFFQRQQSGVKPRLDIPDPQGPQVQTVGFSIPANKCGLIIGKGQYNCSFKIYTF